MEIELPTKTYAEKLRDSAQYYAELRGKASTTDEREYYRGIVQGLTIAISNLNFPDGYKLKPIDFKFS